MKKILLIATVLFFAQALRAQDQPPPPPPKFTEIQVVEDVESVARSTNDTFRPFFIQRPDGLFKVLKTAETYRRFEIAESPSVHLEDIDSFQSKMDSSFSPRYFINLNFNEKGARDLKELTENIESGYLALIINETVVMMPAVLNPISGGKLQIAGMDKEKQEDMLSTLKRILKK